MAFTEAFRTKGFEPCSNGSPEAGLDKIVLYVRGINNFPSHAARQIPTGEHAGSWLSKIGENIDIIHEKPESLAGQQYGTPTHYFKRDEVAHQRMIAESKAQKLIGEKNRKRREKKEQYEVRKKKRKKHRP
ncbi:MAG: hypothetical protein ABSG91_08415 [Syntrophobacteraceae bacterium]